MQCPPCLRESGCPHFASLGKPDEGDIQRMCPCEKGEGLHPSPPNFCRPSTCSTCFRSVAALCECRVGTGWKLLTEKAQHSLAGWYTPMGCGLDHLLRFHAGVLGTLCQKQANSCVFPWCQHLLNNNNSHGLAVSMTAICFIIRRPWWPG